MFPLSGEKSEIGTQSEEVEPYGGFFLLEVL
jgi:hypothetical protein